MIKLFSNKKRNYKIAIIGSLPAYLGAKQHSGLGNVVWGIANELKKNNVDFVILAKGKYYQKFTQINGIDIYGLRFSALSVLKLIYVCSLNLNIFLNSDRITDKFRLIYALYFLIYFRRKVIFKLSHLHHVTNQFPIAFKILKISVPIIAHIHSYSSIINETSLKKQEKIIRNICRQLNCVDYVIHVSNSVREQGLKFKIHWLVEDCVIYNGLSYSFETIQHLQKQKSRGIICFAGAFLKIKGIEILLDSLPQIKSHLKKIIWIGDGPLKEEIINRCEAHSIEYEMTGLISNEKVLSILSESNVMVLPSRSESFGQVYIESILMGTPIIGYHSTINEFREVLFNSRLNSALIPFDTQTQSHEDLSKIIVELLNKSIALDEESRRNLLSQIHWSKLIKEYLIIYKKFLYAINT